MSDNDKDDKDELRFAIKAAEQSLPKGTNYHIGEILAFLEGMAPFLDKDNIVRLKCHNCDNYATSFFPVEGDFEVVTEHEYCHAKKQTLQHLSFFTIAKCMEYSKNTQKELLDLANTIVEKDLCSTLADKRLYDRNFFASYDVKFLIKPQIDKVCIEFGHKTNGDFVESGIRLCLLRRLDPGFGEQTLKIKAAQKHGKVIMVAMVGRQIRRQMGIDGILDKIAEKYDMDIVYL
ncbi:MAG: hypothetical protein ACXQT4_03975 [Methanotrichaceae archaeon]